MEQATRFERSGSPPWSESVAKLRPIPIEKDGFNVQPLKRRSSLRTAAASNADPEVLARGRLLLHGVSISLQYKFARDPLALKSPQIDGRA